MQEVAVPAAGTDRPESLFRENLHAIHCRADRLFAGLMILQWIAGIAVALWISPRTWIGAQSLVHWHVWAAIFLGGAIASLPVYLALYQPGAALTRHTVAVSQILSSVLLIHLTGGRIETHFHVFGSLAFLAFYRDWRVLATATAVVALDHATRGIFWPLSVFGTLTTSPWRWIEHAGWVLFEDIFLFISIRQSTCEMHDVATRQVRLEMSEERFRTLSDSAPIGIYQTNAAGDCVYVNPHWQSLTGFSLGQALQKGWEQAVHPEDLAVATADWTENPGGLAQFRFRRPDGDTRFLNGRAARIPSRTGENLGHVGTIEDATERRRAEALKAGEREVFELLAKGGTIGEALTLLVRIVEAQITDLVCSVLLLDEDGKHLRHGAGPNLPEGYSQLIDGVAIGPAAGSCGTAAYCKQRVIVSDISADPLWSDFREIARRFDLRACWSQPIFSEGNAVLGTLAMYCSRPREPSAAEIETIETAARLASVAITRKRIERELEQARDVAVESARLKSEFLANMSHEIRTPMNGIIGLTDLLLESKLEAGQKEYLGMVKNSSYSLLGLINDILDFSKIEAGKMEMQSIPFSLRDTVRDLLQPLAIAAGQKELRFTTVIPADVPNHLRGDPLRLGQILINLTANAIKFTQRGEIRVAVAVDDALSNRPGEVRLRFSVSDTGIGIPAEKQSMIFGAFAQADGSTTRTYGGTGLGLAIASQLAQRMGGIISLESEVGQGTTFHFTLQVALSSSSIPEGPELPETPRENGGAAALGSLRILIAEDNAINRAVATGILAKRGHTLVHAENGREAVEAFARASFHVVLMDIQMPEMDGFEATRRIREMEASNGGSHTSIIAMTAHAMTGDRERCLAGGMDDYISKPLEKEKLLEIIERVPHLPSSSIPPSSPPPDLITRTATEEEDDKGNALRVLIADDHPGNYAVAAGFLKREGHSVRHARNGREAVEFYQAEPFDLVLMDVQMPDLDGFGATARIRDLEEETLQRTPIVAMTARAMAGDREFCLASGMDDYLAKPLQKEKLFEIVARVSQSSSSSLPSSSSDLRARTTTRTRTSTKDEHDGEPAGPIFSRAKMLEQLDDDEELLEKMVTLFRESTPRNLDEIRSAIASADAAGLARSAHAFLSSSGAFGATAANRVTRELEAMGRANDLVAASATFAQLECEAERIGVAMENFLCTTT